jgi:diadenosine tetraphosphate (Ap4A) HIT family hydrolase
MKTSCQFCRRDQQLEERVFYDRKNWYALLAAPANARGHAILALKPGGARCPKKLLRAHLQGLDAAIADVVEALEQRYKPKDVLVASLRALDPHVHWHLIPLWTEQEREWRRRSHHEKGHLFEFLADIDKDAQSNALDERMQQDWSTADQRQHFNETLRSQVSRLRVVTGYAAGSSLSRGRNRATVS